MNDTAPSLAVLAHTVAVATLAREMFAETYPTAQWPPTNRYTGAPDLDMAEVYVRSAHAEIARRDAAVIAEREACAQALRDAIEDGRSSPSEALHDALAAIRARDEAKALAPVLPHAHWNGPESPCSSAAQRCPACWPKTKVPERVEVDEAWLAEIEARPDTFDGLAYDMRARVTDEELTRLLTVVRSLLAERTDHEARAYLDADTAGEPVGLAVKRSVERRDATVAGTKGAATSPVRALLRWLQDKTDLPPNVWDDADIDRLVEEAPTDLDGSRERGAPR